MEDTFHTPFVSSTASCGENCSVFIKLDAIVPCSCEMPSFLIVVNDRVLQMGYFFLFINAFDSPGDFLNSFLPLAGYRRNKKVSNMQHNTINSIITKMYKTNKSNGKFPVIVNIMD